MCRFCFAMTSRECAECGRRFTCSPNYRGEGVKCSGCRQSAQAVARQTAAHPASRYRQDARPASLRGADGYGPARGCIACGASGSGHSHRGCVLLGAALHRKLDPHKDMKDVVDVILRLLLWDWRETRVDGEILCLSYAPNCDIIAAGCVSGQLFFINAQTGEKILCPVSGHSHIVSCLAFKPDDANILVSCSLDKTLKIWDLSTATCLSTVTGHRYVPSLSREYFLSCF